MSRSRFIARALVAAIVACGLLAGLACAARAAAPPQRWVAVSVATLWTAPDLARAVDAPACADPADPGAWIAAMTSEQKRWLVGRLETQALYGTRVFVLDTSGAWSKIAVPSQPTPRDALRLPGLGADTPAHRTSPAAEHRHFVRPSSSQPTAWLWKTPELTGRALQLSYGTRLPPSAWTPDSVEVARARRPARLRAPRRRRPARAGRPRGPRSPARGSSRRRGASSACSTCGPARRAVASTARASRTPCIAL